MDTFDQAGREVEFAIDFIKAACDLTRVVEASMITPALEKHDKSPVTVAD